LVDEHGVNAPAPRAVVAARYALLALVCGAALIYFTWRCGVVDPRHPVFGWFVLAVEGIGFARTLLFLLSAVRLSHRAQPAAPAGLRVDVFVTTVDEPAEIVRRTLAAACALRYPHETWLLDDGDRPAMRSLAGEFGCRYLARDKHAAAKAGNLNSALAVAGGDFVAVFDADHVPAPNFLDRTLGYFAGERVAFVQTPHEFSNGDSFDHLSPGRTDRTVRRCFIMSCSTAATPQTQRSSRAQRPFSGAARSMQSAASQRARSPKMCTPRCACMPPAGSRCFIPRSCRRGSPRSTPPAFTGNACAGREARFNLCCARILPVNPA
jgi:hypothetical protein